MLKPDIKKIYSFKKPTSLQSGSEKTCDFFPKGSTVFIFKIALDEDNSKYKVWFIDQEARINWVPYLNFEFWFDEVPSPFSDPS